MWEGEILVTIYRHKPTFVSDVCHTTSSDSVAHNHEGRIRVMDGVRISGIKQDITKESIWKYFSGIVGTCGRVSKVYYPLMNNDAVIIFSNTEALQELQSQSHEKFTVHPLPHEVFTKVQVWVDSKISALLLASKVYRDELTNGGGVQIGWEETTQEIFLGGKMYEVEWAQKYLSDVCDNHSRAHSTLVSSLITGRGGVDVICGIKSLQLTNGDRLRDMSAAGEQYSQPTQEEWEWSRGNEKVACSSHDCHSLKLPTSKPSFSASSLETDEPTATFENGRVKQNSSLTKMEINHSMHHNDGESKILSSEHGDKERLRQQNSNDAFQYLKSNLGAEGSHLLQTGAARFHWLEEDKSMSGLSQSPLLSMGCGISGPSTDHRSKDTSEKFIGAYGELSDDELNGAYGGETLLGSNGTALFLASAINADLISRNFSINSQLKLKENQYPIMLLQMLLRGSHKIIAEHFCEQIYCEDIVRVQTDAVVSPANSHLHNIGGVARALEYAAGPEMQEECSKIVRKIGRLMTTQVVETKACGRLGHLKYVFHAVGPIVSIDVEQSIYELSETFFNCLELAEKLHLRSLAFPFISTGIFGMSTDHCVLALITAVLAFPEMSACISLHEVHFVHNDVNVVGEAIILADQQLENEDKESAKQRLQQGRQLYRLYDSCPHNLSSSSRSYRPNDSGRQTIYDTDFSSLPSATSPNKENYPSSSYSRESSCHDDLDIQQLLSTSTSGQTRRRSGSLDRGKGSTSSLTSQKNESSPASRLSSSLASRRSVARAHSFTSHVEDAAMMKKTGLTDVRPKEGTKTKKSPLLKQTLTTRTPKQSKYEPLNTGTVKKSAPLTTKTTQPSNHVLQESTSSSNSSSRKQPAEMAYKKGRYSKLNSTSDSDTSETADGEDSDDICPVCLQKLQSPKKLKCGHVFCLLCIEQAMKFKPRCPKCQYNYGIQTGSQPQSGRMTHRISTLQHIPGFPHVGSIIIDYDFPSGVQEACHPNPGKWYGGTHRTAYLPNTAEGLNILQMLKKAFDHRLVFTIGDSRTTGANNVITWNDIHHKTSIHGGPENFGYPDAGYLIRVKEELVAKGITSP